MVIRRVTASASEIVEESHYYPFGMKQEGYNNIVQTTRNIPAQRYKYQGQERNEELNLNWDSFKWRNYDFALGRFMSIDPLAEEYEDYTPYQFASNQPVHAQEVEGLENAHDLNKRIEIRHSSPTSNDAISRNTQMARTVQLATSTPLQRQVSLRQQPILSQGSSAGQLKANAAKAASIERAKNIVSNHDNLGSPYTQNSVMTGAAYGAVDYATGAIAGKVASGVSKIIKGNSTTKVFRVFGGDAKADGFSWTTENPLNVTNFRDAAGLPSGGASGSTNTAEFMIEGTVKNKSIINTRTALPLDGNKGGLRELIIDPKNVKVKSRKTLQTPL